jgi:hypothetical protein
MWKKVQRGFEDFREDEAGERFKNLYERMQRRGLGVRLIGFFFGVLLTVLGFFLGLVPGIPGFVLGFVGIGLMAAQFQFLAASLDRGERLARRWIRKFPAKKQRAS